jgi:glycerol kinase
MSIESTEGVYLVPAFVGLGAPHWDSDARGLLCGLTQGAGRAHLTRAGLESMAYQVDDILALMQQASGASIAHLKVDGGVSRSNFLMQFLADVLNLPVHRMLDTELTAKGAGYLAGLGAHFWESPEAIAALPQPEDIFPPTMAPHVRGTLKQGWQAAIQRTLLTPEAAHCVGEPVG